MANLEVEPGWPGVRQLENEELAWGGANGNMNEQAKALTARTEFLYQEKANKSEIVQGVFEFDTYAEFNAAKSTLPINCSVVISEENTTGTGQWASGNNRWNGTTLKKSSYDPVVKANHYTDVALEKNNPSFKTLTINDGLNTLTEVQANTRILYFQGTLTANAVIEFPKQNGEWTVQNGTVGGFNIVLKVVGQEPAYVEIAPNEVSRVYSQSTTIRLIGRQYAKTTSPVFTGSPKAPTPTTLTNDLSIANALFVWNALNYADAQAVAISLTGHQTDTVEITADQFNRNLFIVSGTMTSDINLVFPSNRLKQVWVRNETNGVFNLNIKTLNQSNSIVSCVSGSTSHVFCAGPRAFVVGTSKAELNSPVFTGSPMAPTPTRANIGNHIATTKFLKDWLEYPYLSIVAISVTDVTSDIVLTDTQMERNFFTFSGTLTSDLNVVIPNGYKKQFFVRNSTNGGFKLLFKVSGQTIGIVESETGSTLNLFLSSNSVNAVGTEKANLKSPVFTGSPKTPTATADSNDNTIASTAFARRAANNVSAITVDNSFTALTATQVAYKVLRISGTLTANLTLDFPSGIGKWTIINNTTGGFSLFFKATSQTSNIVEVKSGLAEEVYLYNGVLRKVPYSSSSSGGGITEIPVATANVLGGIKVGSGLTINGQGVLSAAGQSSGIVGNYAGQFKYSGKYYAGDVVQHGSGYYYVKEQITDPISPVSDSRMVRMFNNNYAGNDRSLTVLSTEMRGVVSTPNARELSEDGMITFGVDGRYLRLSFDCGLTWESGNIADFGTGVITWVRDTQDGELLACHRNTTVTPNTYTIYKSTGWKKKNIAPTWTQVFQTGKPSVSLNAGWGYSKYKNFILVSEYGAKTGVAINDLPNGAAEGEYARYVYMSKDNGETWKTIFDLSNFTDGLGVHVHGALFDEYWNRIWVSHGDGHFGSNGLFYSDDLGKTWTSATEFHNQGANFSQTVHMVSLPTCILLASDSYPNGIHRIDRAQGKIPVKGYYDIETAYMIPNQMDRLNYLCQGVSKPTYMPNMPITFAFCAETQPGYSTVVSTFDGWTFKEVWIDPQINSIGYGCRAVIGPTYHNEIIITCYDTARESAWYEVRAKVAID